jgi:hypothetical protein
MYEDLDQQNGALIWYGYFYAKLIFKKLNQEQQAGPELLLLKKASLLYVTAWNSKNSNNMKEFGIKVE